MFVGWGRSGGCRGRGNDSEWGWAHTWFHGLQADGLPKVADDSQRVSVGESAHRSSVHLQQHVPAAGKPPRVTHHRFRNYVSKVGELSQLSAASHLNYSHQLPGSPPGNGALLHFSGPVLLLFQCLGHCWWLFVNPEGSPRAIVLQGNDSFRSLRRNDAREKALQIREVEAAVWRCIPFQEKQVVFSLSSLCR